MGSRSPGKGTEIGRSLCLYCKSPQNAADKLVVMSLYCPCHRRRIMRFALVCTRSGKLCYGITPSQRGLRRCLARRLAHRPRDFGVCHTMTAWRSVFAALSLLLVVVLQRGRRFPDAFKGLGRPGLVAIPALGRLDVLLRGGAEADHRRQRSGRLCDGPLRRGRRRFRRDRRADEQARHVGERARPDGRDLDGGRGDTSG